MSEQLEQNLRATLSERATQISPAAVARLRAVDYRPWWRRRPSRPALGALGLSGAAATAGAIVLLGSSAPAAFAGWSPTPTAPHPGQLAAAAAQCSAGLGSPVITDTRGPYTAAIYAEADDSDTCLQGGSVSIDQASSGGNQGTVAAGQIQLSGGGVDDSSGNALTLVDGRVGAGVTAVTIERSDGSSVQATVSNGWYLAWWPATVSPTSAQVTTATGTATQQFPNVPAQSAPSCPAGAHCEAGYGYGSAASSSSRSTSSSSGTSGSSSSGGSGTSGSSSSPTSSGRSSDL
jgi:hypothetical protein